MNNAYKSTALKSNEEEGVNCSDWQSRTAEKAVPICNGSMKPTKQLSNEIIYPKLSILIIVCPAYVCVLTDESGWGVKKKNAHCDILLSGASR